MLQKITTLLLLIYLIFNVHNAFAYTCEKDNKIDSEGLFCCCTLDTTTSEPKVYICKPQKIKCAEGDVPAGMKDKNGKKLCPCKMVIRS